MFSELLINFARFFTLVKALLIIWFIMNFPDFIHVSGSIYEQPPHCTMTMNDYLFDIYYHIRYKSYFINSLLSNQGFSSSETRNSLN